MPPRLRIDTAGERAVSLFGELGASTVDRKLDLHGTIGEGGMGIVHLGTQRALGREQEEVPELFAEAIDEVARSGG
ncbi:MAG: hypothetical protein M5U28_42430 [Sandaracinaceae bacterium]|nr:hypothetical protein [Sandaracinaceae bacterium]